MTDDEDDDEDDVYLRCVFLEIGGKTFVYVSLLFVLVTSLNNGGDYDCKQYIVIPRLTSDPANEFFG